MQVKKYNENPSQFKMPWIIKPQLGWNSAGISHTSVTLNDIKDTKQVIELIIYIFLNRPTAR
jgi:hypothetical protein